MVYGICQHFVRTMRLILCLSKAITLKLFNVYLVRSIRVTSLDIIHMHLFYMLYIYFLTGNKTFQVKKIRSSYVRSLALWALFGHMKVIHVYTTEGLDVSMYMTINIFGNISYKFGTGLESVSLSHRKIVMMGDIN